MLPPPITTPISTPSSMTPRISSATCSSTLGEMPYLLSPISASPDSFSRMRLNRVAVGFSGKVRPRRALAPREANLRGGDGQGRSFSVRVLRDLLPGELGRQERPGRALQGHERLDLQVRVRCLQVL